MERVFNENGPDMIIERMERHPSEKPSKVVPLAPSSEQRLLSQRASAMRKEAAMQELVDRLFPGKNIDLSERMPAPKTSWQLTTCQ